MKLIQKAFVKHAKLALADADSFQKFKVRDDSGALLSEVLKTRDGENYVYSIASHLHLASNQEGRISFAQLIDGETYPVNLADCWAMKFLSISYMEQDLLKSGEQAQWKPDCFENIRTYRIPSDVNYLAFAVWKLYCMGESSAIERAIHLFSLFDVRQDVTCMGWTIEQLQAYEVSVSLSLFIGRGKGDAQTAERLLGAIPIFKDIAQFWEDDVAFTSFTERAAQWHFDYSVKNWGEDWAFAASSNEVLIPSWVLALDLFRQKQLGRPSCLGSHELLALGLELISLARSQNHPKLPALVAAQQHYDELFGKEMFNPVPFWEKFLGLESS